MIASLLSSLAHTAAATGQVAAPDFHAAANGQVVAPAPHTAANGQFTAAAPHALDNGQVAAPALHAAAENGQVAAPSLTVNGQTAAPHAAADSRLRLMYRAYQASRPKLRRHNSERASRKEVNPEFHMMMIVLSSVR